jgi:carbamoyl-phosphate synthase large subunit|tara:strand:+ start:22780 stop:23814 length:1035 start_codon:yes stop_codon:yes gene_type:complete
METIKRILVTGGGAPGAPGILKSIAKEAPELTIYACDAQSETAGKLLADGYFTVPLGTAPNFVEVLLAKCIKHNIQAVLPITTRELEPLSKARSQFEQAGIHLIVSESKDLDIANDKGKLYTHLSQHSIPVPAFGIANTYAEYKEIKQGLKKDHKRFIVKPCKANGSRGFRIVDSSVNKHDLLFNHKPSSTYISEEELDDILCESFPPLLVSEHLPGDEYTVDCLVQNGIPQLIIPRRRDKMNAGISVAGEIVNNPEVIAYCAAILATLKLHGPIGIQVKYSKDNIPLLVEINPRIQGTTVALMGAGINIPLLSITNGLRSKSLNETPIKWGTRFIRHYEELYF